MPRVIGIDIPDNKRLEISLTYIFGVGRIARTKSLPSWPRSKYACKQVNAR